MSPGPSNLNAEPDVVLEREAVSLLREDFANAGVGALARAPRNRCDEPEPLVLLREKRRVLGVAAEVSPPELELAVNPVLGRRTTPRWFASDRLPLRVLLLSNCSRPVLGIFQSRPVRRLRPLAVEGGGLLREDWPNMMRPPAAYPSYPIAITTQQAVCSICRTV